MKNAGVEGVGKARVTLAGVLRKRADRGGVERDLALLLLLARADVHHAVAEIDVVAVERERLSGTHSGDGQQPDHGHVACGAQRWREPACGVDQRRDLRVCIDVWRDPWAMPGQKVGGGNLAGGVDRREIPGEPASDGEPLAPAVRMRADRHPRPHQR